MCHREKNCALLYTLSSAHRKAFSPACGMWAKCIQRCNFLNTHFLDGHTIARQRLQCNSYQCLSQSMLRRKPSKSLWYLVIIDKILAKTASRVNLKVSNLRAKSVVDEQGIAWKTRSTWRVQCVANTFTPDSIFKHRIDDDESFLSGVNSKIRATL